MKIQSHSHVANLKSSITAKTNGYGGGGQGSPPISPPSPDMVRGLVALSKQPDPFAVYAMVSVLGDDFITHLHYALYLQLYEQKTVVLDAQPIKPALPHTNAPLPVHQSLLRSSGHYQKRQVAIIETLDPTTIKQCMAMMNEKDGQAIAQIVKHGSLELIKQLALGSHLYLKKLSYSLS